MSDIVKDPLTCPNCGESKPRLSPLCSECADAPKEPPMREPADREGRDAGDEHWGAD